MFQLFFVEGISNRQILHTHVSSVQQITCGVISGIHQKVFVILPAGQTRQVSIRILCAEIIEMFFEIVVVSTKHIVTSGNRKISLSHTLQQCRYFKTFISQIQVDTERIFGSRITNNLQISVISQSTFTTVYSTIPIGIDIF